MKKTQNPLINNFPKASDTTTRSQSRYAAQDYKKNLADALSLQIDQQPEYIAAHQYDTHTLSTLFEHTKRDALEFLRNQWSVRIQLCFSPLDNIDAKIAVPSTGTPEANKHALYASIIEIDRLPHALIVDRGKRMRNNHPEIKIPQRFHLFHKDQDIRKQFIAEYYKTFDFFIKEYLITALPTDYFLDDTLTSTPRVLRVGSLYILTQSNPLIYTEKHLKNRKGTNLFLKIFTTREEYLAYEQQTIAKLEQQKIRFTLWNDAYTRGIHDFITQRKASIENNNKKPFGTSTDKRIDQELNKLLEKKNTQYFSHYITKIGQLLQERLDAIDAMIKTIQAQIEGF